MVESLLRDLDRRQFLTRLAAVAAVGLSWQTSPAAAARLGVVGEGLSARRQVTYESLIVALADVPGSPIPTENTTHVAQQAASALDEVYRMADVRFQTNVNAFLDAVVGKRDFSPTTDADVARFESKSPRGRRDELRTSLRSSQDRPLRLGRTPERPILGSFSQAILADQGVLLALAPFADPEFSSPQSTHPVLEFLVEGEG
jgi:hypothetical protein